MSYDLVPLLDLSWSDAFSAIALVFSGIALIGTLRLSKQVERRVDGELGELLPNFALYPAATAVASREGTRILELRIDNYNRRPIRLTRLRIEQPSKLGLVAYHLVGVREMLLGDTNRRHDEVWTSLVVEGTPPGASNFSSTRLKLVVSGKEHFPRRKHGTKIALGVEFELLKDVPERQCRSVSCEIEAASQLERTRTVPEVPAAA
jgi:hypothetical protein